eukprot:gene9803-10647_t
MSFDGLKNTLNNAGVASFDGFRMAVQKQINLNTVTSHFYWIGSQVTGRPIYQYRIIFPFDDGKLINLATDVDCSSVDGEVKIPLSPSVQSKTNFSLTSEQNQLQSELEIAGSSSTTLLQFAKSSDTVVSLSYMQSITPTLTLGGLGSYALKMGDLTTAVGASYADGDHSVYLQWDNNLKVMYQRRVNPNRVNLSTDLVVDDSGNSQMSLNAEYILKQSKLQMSVDSNLHLKSVVETSVISGFQLQFSAEMSQFKDVYRFGYGVFMG